MRIISKRIIQTLIAVPFVGLLGFAGPAFADSIGGASGCTGFGHPEDTCNGASYTISYSGSIFSTTATEDIYRFTLEIGTDTYTGPVGSIEQVGIKVASTLTSANIVSSPGGGWNALANVGVNNGGAACGGAGGGFVCSTGGMAALPFNGTYTWVFDLGVATGTSLLTGPGAASVKALYLDANGRKTGAITSEPITLMIPCSPNDPTCGPGGNPVPEPGTIFLMGSGLAGLGFWRWKKGTKSQA